MSRLSVLNNYTFQKWRIPGVESFRTLLPTDISVRPEDFLKCLKWNKTYAVVSSISCIVSWLNPITQETKKFAGKDVQGRIVSTSKNVYIPHIKNFWIASPNISNASSTKHSTSTLLRRSDVIGLYEKNIRLQLCLGLFDVGRSVIINTDYKRSTLRTIQMISKNHQR